jgi:SAM-dependent methyltransferase
VSTDPPHDKIVDVSRYDDRARNLLSSQDEKRGDRAAANGASSIEPVFRAPYLFYEQCVRRLVRSEHAVLELGAGIGRHTPVLLETGAMVTATDLSPNSTALLERNLGSVSAGRLRTRVADLEALPFEDASFDVVACAGSLSYGDPKVVDAEIRRVLRPRGAFVCVDSLNHNPIYRLNRWLQYLRGARTRSTLVRMPTLARLDSITAHFTSADVRYFGAVSWAMPVVTWITGQQRAASFSDAFDRLVHTQRLAFKFVLVAQGRE